MKKQFSWFIAIGALLMALPVLTTSVLNIPIDTADFIKGLGAGIIIAAFFVQVWHHRKHRNDKYTV